jgi:hypothetical protein
VNTITACRWMSNTGLWMGLYQVMEMPKQFHSKPRTENMKALWAILHEKKPGIAQTKNIS